MKIVAFEVEVGGVSQIINNLDALKQAVRDTNKAFQGAELGTKEYEKQGRQLATLKNLQKDVRDEARKTGREQVIAADKGKNSYRALNAELVNLRARFKDLSAADRNGTVGQNLIKQISALDGELKTIDKSIGLYQRNVGNYKQALIGIGDVVTGGLITGGIQAIASKAVQGFKEAIQIVADFEKGLSNLSSITGLQGQELEDLGDEALRLGVKYSTSATEVLKAFQLIGSASPELLSLPEDLVAVTEQVQILAKASGLELPVAAEAVTKAMNQFGLAASDTAELVDILATSQQKGTATIQQLSEAMKNVGAVANASNIDFEKTNVLLQALAKGGLTGAEAGTKLRGVLLKLAQTNRDDLNPSTQDFGEILNTLEKEVLTIADATAIFGAENASAALTLIEQKGVVEELNGALNEQGNALAQATTNSDNLQGATAKFKATYDALIINVDKGTGIFSKSARGLVDFGTSFLDTLQDINDEGFLDVFLRAINPMEAVRIEMENLKEQAAETEGQLESYTDTINKNNSAISELTALNNQVGISQEEIAINLEKIGVLQRENESIQNQANEAKEKESELNKENSETLEDVIAREAEAAKAKEKSTAATKEALTPLQQLNQQQKELADTIKESILSGEDYTDELAQWEENQTRLNFVSDEFKEIQKALSGEVDTSTDSIKFLSGVVKDLKEELSNSSGNDITKITADLIKAEKQLQAVKDEISDAQFNANNPNSSGASQSGVDAEVEAIKARAEFEATTAANTIANSEDLQRERVRLSLQADIDILKQRLSLWQEGTDQAIALEAQLAEKRAELQSGNDANAFQDRVDEINELSNLEIAANEKSALSIEDKAAKRKEIETQATVDILNAELDLAETTALRKAEIARELADIESGIAAERDEREKLSDEARTQRRFEQLTEIFEGANEVFDAQQARIDADEAKQIAAINDRYQAEIDAAEGNADALAEIEARRDAEIEEVERAAFERSKKIQIAQAKIAAALGIINILSTASTIPDPFGAIFKGIRIAALIAQTAANISEINAQQFFEGGYTDKNFKFGKRDSTGSRPTPLIQYHEKEYVVPNKVLATRAGQSLVNQLEGMRTGRPMSDNATMGRAGMPANQPIPNYSPREQFLSVSASATMEDDQINNMASLIGQEAGKAIERANLKAIKENDRIARRKERLKKRMR